MNKFLTYLKNKGISDADYKAKTEKEQAELFTQFVDKELTDINKRVEKANTKEAFDALKTELATFKEGVEGKDYDKQINDLDQAIKELKEKGAVTEEKTTIIKELKKYKDDIFEIAKGNSSKEVVLKADTVRASIGSNTQGYELPDIGQIATRKLTMWDLFPKIPISESNNQATIKYWDWTEATTVRAAAAIAEGGTFAEDTAKWTQYTLQLQKIGSVLPVSDEFEEDAAMFAAELGLFMDTSVQLKIDTDLTNANGTPPNIKGIVSSVDAYTAAASGITDANIYDLLVKVSESITDSGGGKYSPDVVLMNITDINKMKLKKDANHNYIIPPFVSRDGKQVAGMIVVENNAITANTLVLGDRRFAKIYHKPGVVLSKGYSGTQFVEDMMTLKARKRLAFLIRTVDKTGWAKVTSISADLITLAS